MSSVREGVAEKHAAKEEEENLVLSLEDRMESLLLCGKKVKQLWANQIKSEVKTRELLSCLEQAEQALRQTPQGEKEVQNAAGGSFAKGLVHILLTPTTTTTNKYSGGHSTKTSRGGGGGSTAAKVLELKVRAVSACCFALLLRLFAPTSPFSDTDLERVFTECLLDDRRREEASRKMGGSRYYGSGGGGGGLLPQLLQSKTASFSSSLNASGSGRNSASASASSSSSASSEEIETQTETETELFARGVFLLETLREVKACLLLLDFGSDEALCCLITCLLSGTINHHNISDIKQSVLSLLGEVLQEGASELTDRVWEKFLTECVQVPLSMEAKHKQILHSDRRRRTTRTRSRRGKKASKEDNAGVVGGGVGGGGRSRQLKDIWKGDTPEDSYDEEEDEDEDEGEENEFINNEDWDLHDMDGGDDLENDGLLQEQGEGRGENKSSVIVARELLKRNSLALSPHIHKFLDRLLTSGSTSGVSSSWLSQSDLKEDYCNLIFSLYLAAPEVLVPVLPKLSLDLDQAITPSKRTAAVELVGQLLWIGNGDFASKYGGLFQSFLDRFDDRVPAVRLKVIAIAECILVKHLRENANCLLHEIGEGTPARAPAAASSVAVQLFQRLNDKLVDPDTSVRVGCVSALGHILARSPSCQNASQSELFLGRLRDTKLAVRSEVCVQLAQIFSAHIGRIHFSSSETNTAASLGAATSPPSLSPGCSPNSASGCSSSYGQDEERVSCIPLLLLKSYNSDKELRTRGPLEQVLSESLFPSGLTDEEVVQHWVVIASAASGPSSFASASASAADDGSGSMTAPGLNHPLFRCLQLKLAVRNSITQLLKVVEEWRKKKREGPEEREASCLSNWRRRTFALCEKIARNWLSDADKGAAALKKLVEMQLEEVDISKKMASIVSHGTKHCQGQGDLHKEGLKLKKSLLELVRSKDKDKGKNAQHLVSALSQVCDCLLCTPLAGRHMEALLKFFLSRKRKKEQVDNIHQGEGEEEEGEEEGEGFLSFGEPCRSFAVHVAHADPGAFKGHLDLLLEMLLLEKEEDEVAPLTALQLLQITYSSSFNRGEAAALIADVSPSESAALEAVLVKYVQDKRKDVSDKAIRVMCCVMKGERAKEVLKEQAKNALRKLNHSRRKNKMMKKKKNRVELEDDELDLEEEQETTARLQSTCHALSLIGNLASLSDSLTVEARLDVIHTICSILTEPLPLPDLNSPQEPIKGEIKRKMKGSDLFVSAVSCLASLLAPRLESIPVPEKIRLAVPDAMQYVANQLNPLAEFEFDQEEEEEEEDAKMNMCLTKEEEAEIRLASAKTILQVAKRHDSSIHYQTHVDLCLVMQDPSCHVRREFAKALNQLIQHFQTQSPPQVTKASRFAAALALSGADPNQDNVEMTGSYLCRFIAHSTEIIKRYYRKEAQNTQQQQQHNNVFWRPEYVLVYIVHLLAHHTDYPTQEDVDELGIYNAYLPFQQMLKFAMECLCYKRQCDFGLVDKIFETCKHSGEAFNGSTPSMHCIADLAWRLSDQLNTSDVLAPASIHLRVPLPKNLYKIGQERKASQSQGKPNANVKGSCVPEDLDLLPDDILQAALGRGTRGAGQKGRKKPRSRSSSKSRAVPRPEKRSKANDDEMDSDSDSDSDWSEDEEGRALKNPRVVKKEVKQKQKQKQNNKKTSSPRHKKRKQLADEGKNIHTGNTTSGGIRVHSRSEIRAGVKVQSRNQPSRTAKAKASTKLSYLEVSDDKENSSFLHSMSA